MAQRTPPSPPTSSSTPTSPAISAAVHNVLAQTPQGAAQQQLQMQIEAMSQMQAHGPFPSPGAVKAYETILPGTFERILKMAEKAQSDQNDTVRFAQLAQKRDIARVHWMAATISLAAMIGAAFCAWIHEPWVAGCFLGVPVFAVAKAFIDSIRAPNAEQQAQLQRQAQQHQLEQMQQMLQQAAAGKPKGDDVQP